MLDFAERKGRILPCLSWTGDFLRVPRLHSGMVLNANKDSFFSYCFPKPPVVPTTCEAFFSFHKSFSKTAAGMNRKKYCHILLQLILKFESQILNTLCSKQKGQ